MSLSTSESSAHEAPEPSGSFLPGAKWHTSTPRSLANSPVGDTTPDGWKAWKRHLQRRRRPRVIDRLLRSRGVLAWGLHDGLVNSPTLARLSKLAGGKSVGRKHAGHWEAELSSWLSAEQPQHLDLPSAVAALAWCHALPALASLVDPELWWAALARLIAMATEPTGLDTALPPAVWQLAAAELPLTLAYLFPEITSCRQLAVASRQALSAGMEELLDGEGLPRFQQLDSLVPLVGCWTRMRAMAGKTADARWPRSAARQFNQLVRHAVRLSRIDGTVTFTGDRVQPELLRAAARLADDERTRRLVRKWAAGLGRAPGRHELALGGQWSKKGPKPPAHSEWSELAMLRRDFSPGSPRLAVGYSARQLVCEAAAGRHVLFSGPCQPIVRSAGRLLEPTTDWEETCWVSDEDGDYIELEMTLAASVRVQRQMYLARRDLFLFSADAVLASEPMPIEYQVTYPVANPLTVKSAEETQEMWLTAKKRQATVLPLALGEWKNDNRGGRLTAEGRQLTLTQSVASGRGLFAPLWFDLNRARIGLPLTWRQLTVAENRENQPADLAVGYRVQIGQQHWLVYRSLTGGANRTVLGHHLLSQFLIAQFTTDGEVLPLVEIE